MPGLLRLLSSIVLFSFLSLLIISLHSCSKQQEHKWLFYDLEAQNGLVYQGYTKTLDSMDDGTLGDIQSKRLPQHLTTLDKPTIDEDDQVHFVVFGAIPAHASCQFAEGPYAQPHDSKVVRRYQMTLAKGDLEAKGEQLLQAEQMLIGHQIVAKSLELNAKQLDQAAAEAKRKAKQGPRNRTLNEKADAATQEAQEARLRAQTASDNVADAEALRNLRQAQWNEMKAELDRKSIVCDLDVREKGSTKIDYTLANKQKAKATDITADDIVLKDSVLVHELYRYRILAGPVFSTLQKHNKNYKLSPNNAGQTVITATDAQDSPANFVLLLKTYLTKRDVLDPPSLFSKPWYLSERWYEAFNPIIGINLFDKPLQNFYAGLSFEPWGGVDIIGGAHWAKTQQLVGGFSQGQVVTTQTSGLTKERFNNGWFVGVAADVGVVTTWLKSAGSGIITAIKTNP